MKCPNCGLPKLYGGAEPNRKTYFDIVKQSYESSAARQVGDWTLVAESPTIKIYQMDGDAIVSIRGTFDAQDTQADTLIPFNGLESSSRFKKDIKFLDSFQKQNPGLQYFGVGHSLGGAILDLFLHNGMITRGQSYNPAVQPRDFSTTLPNNRIFMSGDPLYTLVKLFLKQKPEVIKENSSMFRTLARLTPIGNVLTSGDYLKSHGLEQFEGKGKTHKQNVLKKLKLKDTGYSVQELAGVSGVPLQILQEVYNRGIGAYKTNPQSVRMKVTFKKGPAPMSKKLSKEQWAMARVYSFLDGNPKHDQDLIEV